MELLNKTISQEYKEINEKERTVTHYISTPEVDSFNEILMPRGMDDTRFKAVLWSHSLGRSWLTDETPPPSEFVIGKSLWRKRTDEGVIAKTQFAETTLGNELLYFNKAGFIKSWSVGWLPKGQKMVDDKTGVITYENWYLYEYSNVVIPANAGAVNLMLEETKSLQLKNILTTQQNYFNMEQRLQEFSGLNDKIKSLEDEITLLKSEPIPDDNKFKELEQEIQQLKEKLGTALKRNAEYRRYFLSGKFESKKLSQLDIAEQIKKEVSKLIGKKYRA